MHDDVRPDVWSAEQEELLVRVGHRFGRVDLRRRMRAYVHSLLGPVGRKNSWQLAEHAGHRTPAGLQHQLSRACWDPDEIRDDLHGYVAEKFGDPAEALIVDDTRFSKKSTVSAGVQRQHSDTTGRTENRQIDVFAAYGTARGRVPADRELHLPVSWTSDPDGCAQAKIPDGRAFATKGDLAKAIIMRALASALPIAWVTADSAYGQEGRPRRIQTLTKSTRLLGGRASRSPHPGFPDE